jgi:hypothetical protein
MTPLPVTLFDLLQSLPLFVSKIDSDLPVRIGDDLAYSLAGVASHFLKLHGLFIDNRRDFAGLFGRQIELSAKVLLHSNAHQSWMMELQEKVPGVESSQRGAGDSASDKYQKETGHKFPFQRFVHWKNSS